VVISSAGRDEVDAADRLVVLAHIVVALGAAAVVVEGHAGADHVNEGRPAVAMAPLISGTSWALSPEKLRAT
jgi:hypothetical protein